MLGHWVAVAIRHINIITQADYIFMFVCCGERERIAGLFTLESATHPLLMRQLTAKERMWPRGPKQTLRNLINVLLLPHSTTTVVSLGIGPLAPLHPSDVRPWLEDSLLSVETHLRPHRPHCSPNRSHSLAPTTAALTDCLIVNLHLLGAID